MGLLDTYAPAMRFDVKGRRQGGRVVRDAAEVQQRDFDTNKRLYWSATGGKSTDATDPDGTKRDPVMQLVVTVETGVRHEQTGDTERAIFIKGQMLKALRDECRRTRCSAIREGAELYVTYVDDEPPPAGKKGKPSKVYTVELTPAIDNRSTPSLLDPVADEQATPANAAQREALDRLVAGQNTSPILANLRAGSAAKAGNQSPAAEPPF